MVGSKAAHRPTWCWIGGWDFSIWNGRQQEERTTGPGLGFWSLTAQPQWQTSSNRATPTIRPESANSASPRWTSIQIYEHVGVILIQTTTRLKINGTFSTWGRNKKRYGHFGKQCRTFLKSEAYIPVQSFILLWHIHKKHENIWLII